MKKRILIICIVMMLVLILSSCGSDSEGLEITSQPQDVEVSYPDGASFSVKVSKPRAVESYQWILIDQAGNVFELEGVTAKTSKLVVPSTQRMGEDMQFYCVITAKDGTVLESERAVLSKNNGEIDKPVFFVGEYAVEPGETLDLSKVKIDRKHKLGSGTVMFDSNGKDITISNVDFDNTFVSCDLAIASNVAFALEVNHPDPAAEYNVTFVGTNRIINNYYDEAYNAGGIAIDFCFTGTDNGTPLVNFIGDGSLEITNGTNAVRIIGDLMVDIDITVKQSRPYFSDGLYAENIKISQGKKLDLEVYGAAIYSKGNLFVEGADIKIKAHAPSVGMGISNRNVIHAPLSVNIEDSSITIDYDADQDICGRTAGAAGINTGGPFYLTNSSFAYKASVRKGSDIYASNFIGISVGEGEVDNSKVDITMDCEHHFMAYGIYSDQNILFKNSEATVNIKSGGAAYGIAAEMDFSVDDSNIDVNTEAVEMVGHKDAFGIVCENFVIRESGWEKTVRTFAKGGMAVACNLHDLHDRPSGFVSDYTPRNIFMREGAVCMIPADNVVSLGSISNGDDEIPSYMYVETYYSQADTSRPAEELIFGLQ